jgi:4'-phosphopantetheinyl transferase
MAVTIYYTEFASRLEPDRYEAYLADLPSVLQEKIGRFRRWQDACASLLGKQLLMTALSDCGLSHTLNDIKYTTRQRPYLEQAPDFNITHSGSIVALVLSEDSRVGIDVEGIEPIEIDTFRPQFTPGEWMKINGNGDPLFGFYHYWTIKEAVVKADGEGLPKFSAVRILDESRVLLSSQLWFVRPVQLGNRYVCNVAADQEIISVTVKKIVF